MTLQGPPAVSCMLHLRSASELGFSDTACDSCCETLLHMQRKQNRRSSVRASRPFYFLQFQALTFRHCSSFSCPNTFPFFNRIFASAVSAKDDTLTWYRLEGCNSSASQRILWEQAVTCSAHSKKHFKTNLAEYWGEGGGHGRSIYLPD